MRLKVPVLLSSMLNDLISKEILLINDTVTRFKLQRVNPKLASLRTKEKTIQSIILWKSKGFSPDSFLL